MERNDLFCCLCEGALQGGRAHTYGREAGQAAPACKVDQSAPPGKVTTLVDKIRYGRIMAEKFPSDEETESNRRPPYPRATFPASPRQVSHLSRSGSCSQVACTSEPVPELQQHQGRVARPSSAPVFDMKFNNNHLRGDTHTFHTFKLGLYGYIGNREVQYCSSYQCW